MKLRSNSYTLIAIISSVVLLLALEIFWLRMEYENERGRFHRETHLLLRNTILELTDSLFQERLMGIDSLTASTPHDSTLHKAFRKESRVFQVFFDSTSITTFQFPHNKSGRHRKDMLFRYSLDSLDQQLIEHRYRNQLEEAGLKIPMHLALLKDGHREQPVFSTGVVHTPGGAFQLEFTGINWLLLKKMAPQISFSFFLTLLVIGSFVLLYRNLLLQQRLITIKDGLISNISHELKTPITTVAVALEGLKNFKGQNNPAVSDEYLSIAENELKRLSALTEKVLTTSIADYDAAQLHIIHFDFKHLVEEIIQSFRLLAGKQNADIAFSAQPGDYSIEGDKDHLSNMLFNLLDNALKYSTKNPELKIILSSDAKVITVKVADKGIGIAPAFHKKVFDKFFRVPTGDVHQVKGYGLGLSYVKQVVHQLKGKVEIESEPGKGSTFSVTIPKRHERK